MGSVNVKLRPVVLNNLRLKNILNLLNQWHSFCFQPFNDKLKRNAMNLIHLKMYKSIFINLLLNSN